MRCVVYGCVRSGSSSGSDSRDSGSEWQVGRRDPYLIALFLAVSLTGMRLPRCCSTSTPSRTREIQTDLPPYTTQPGERAGRDEYY